MTNQPKFEIIDRNGTTLGPFNNLAEARGVAETLLGEQDDEGENWDVQVVR